MKSRIFRNLRLYALHTSGIFGRESFPVGFSSVITAHPFVWATAITNGSAPDLFVRVSISFLCVDKTCSASAWTPSSVTTNLSLYCLNHPCTSSDFFSSSYRTSSLINNWSSAMSSDNFSHNMGKISGGYLLIHASSIELESILYICCPFSYRSLPKQRLDLGQMIEFNS